MKKFLKILLVLLFAFFLGYFFIFKPEDKPGNGNPPVEEKPSDPEKPVEPVDPDEPDTPDVPDVPDNVEAAFIEKIKAEKYYIPDRLERYINYKEKNENKSSRDIVQEVNCNIDYEFYTHTRPVDLSKGNLILVNKYYYLSESYTPLNETLLEEGKYSVWDEAYLSKTTYDAYTNMLDEAREQGYYLIDTSPYRPYDYQSYLYNNYVKNWGKEQADRSSARPGHSEHQTGFASDVIKDDGGKTGMYGFKDTKEFTWLKENAHKYGFILRYPEGKEYLTGYKYEPWHYRYVGKDVAKYIYENDIVYEEYYAYFCEYKNEC